LKIVHHGLILSHGEVFPFTLSKSGKGKINISGLPGGMLQVPPTGKDFFVEFHRGTG
jgi:hypothetical protein